METRDFLILLTVFTISALISYTFTGSQFETGTTVYEVSTEVNSSQSISTVNFSNHSVDLMIEDGLNSTFYIDEDGDGSADTILDDLNRDGRVHLRNELLDYPSGIYNLKMRYQDDSTEEGDAWLSVYEVEKID